MIHCKIHHSFLWTFGDYYYLNSQSLALTDNLLWQRLAIFDEVGI